MSAPVRWTHVVTAGDSIAFRSGRRGNTLVAEWPGLARVTCSVDGRHARVIPEPGVPADELLKMRGFVRALLSERRGAIGVHGSAVALGARAVLFVGKSGVGKSTAAAEMCLRHGAKLLADDAAILDVRDGVVHAVPSERAVHLTGTSRAALGLSAPPHGSGTLMKPALLLERAKRGYPLALVVALRFDDTVSAPAWRRLLGHEAVRNLVDGMIRFDLTDEVARRRELDNVNLVYGQASIGELTRPRRSASIGELIACALSAPESDQPCVEAR